MGPVPGGKDRHDKLAFAAEAGQQRYIHIAREARLALSCPLDRYAKRNGNFVLVSGEAASTAGAILTPDS